VLVLAWTAQAEDRRASREPAKPRPQASAPRGPAAAAKARLKPDAATAEQARIEAACVRYRLVWGMDCPTENGSGAGGVDPLRDVRRLGVPNAAKK
jgi:hypothetical protein